MGMFDTYRPEPVPQCPRCGAPLPDWQGKDGPCVLFVWGQGAASPIGQDVDDECAAEPSARAASRLPDVFTIYTSCAGCELWIDAHGACDDGTWTRTDLVRPLAAPGAPDGWRELVEDDRVRVVAELRREMASGHALDGKRLLPLLRSDARDHVLFQELVAGGPLWLVHLTWRTETDPRWPVSRAFLSFAAFLAHVDGDD
jgi:hypothetical protein